MTLYERRNAHVLKYLSWKIEKRMHFYYEKIMFRVYLYFLPITHFKVVILSMEMKRMTQINNEKKKSLI